MRRLIFTGILVFMLGTSCGCPGRPVPFDVAEFTVPGSYYAVVGGDVPLSRVLYAFPAETEVIRVRFNRRLKPDQELHLFYLQNGSILAIRRAGTVDPVYGGEPSDVYSIDGSDLVLWPQRGGFPYGLIVLRLPAALAAEDGTTLGRDRYVVLSPHGLTPVSRLSQLNWAPERDVPTLAWPRPRGGPDIRYVAAGSVPVNKAASGSSERLLVLFRGETVRVLGEEGQWARVEILLPGDAEQVGAIPATTEIEKTGFVRVVCGYVPTGSLLSVPETTADGRVTVIRSGMFNEWAQPEAAVFVSLNPYGVRSHALEERSDPCDAAQIAALELSARLDWAEMVGLSASFTYVHINDERISVLDPRARLELSSLTEEEFGEYVSAVDYLRGFVDDHWRLAVLPGQLHPFKDELYRMLFVNPVAVEQSWIDWARAGDAAGAETFGRFLVDRVQFRRLDPATVRESFTRATLDRPDGTENYFEAMAQLFTEEVFGSTGWLTYALTTQAFGRLPAWSEVIRITGVKDGAYLGVVVALSEHTRYLLEYSGQLTVGQAYRIEGQLLPATVILPGLGLRVERAEPVDLN